MFTDNIFSRFQYFWRPQEKKQTFVRGNCKSRTIVFFALFDIKWLLVIHPNSILTVVACPFCKSLVCSHLLEFKFQISVFTIRTKNDSTYWQIPRTREWAHTDTDCYVLENVREIISSVTSKYVITDEG